MEKKIVLSQYEMIDKEAPKGEDFDPLVIENVRFTSNDFSIIFRPQLSEF